MREICHIIRTFKSRPHTLDTGYGLNVSCVEGIKRTAAWMREND